MVRASLILVALVVVVPAWAQQPTGCAAFRWPLDRERAPLAKPSQVSAAEGLRVSSPVTVALQPLAAAKLPQAPSRTPRYPDSYAGFIQASAPASAGLYRVTLSHRAWIDVIQDGRALKSVGFTGAKGCDGVAKSVKFDLAAAPFVIELSGTSAHAIGLVVTPD